MAWLLSDESARAQITYVPVNPAPRTTSRTYGPGLSFGAYGTVTNYRERQNFGYEYGSGVGPAFGLGGPFFNNPAIFDPRAAAIYGYSLPYSAPGYFYQNAATFPPGSPNYDSYSRGYVPPSSVPRGPRWFRRVR
jgi:hypothetical protein